VNKPSPISEGVTEIRINSQLARVQTWQHDTSSPGGHHEWQQFMTRSKSRAGSYLALVPSSTCMPQRTLSHCTPMKQGKISSNSWTHEATMFGDSICLVCVSTFKCLFIRTQSMRALTDIGGGYHLRATNFRSDHSSSFPSSILPFLVISPPSLILNHSINSSFSQTIPLSNQGMKSHKSHEWNLSLDFYWSSIR
jgi:hypothetical protein